ncbi:hypothetical protein NOJ28_19740 [Neorhizobium galegae]|uniref:hypothetical protein n=1 Tax=Neorhizobium galegae TaxID=399 RepID=UPI0021064DE3|nr:hypothetical protein [Neorhizobium galegae]MCQ1767781.1 hypothetical protein [Neorhizobium galegae]MCQ1848120.1 hypothetical protein [Neorhizobium galegae]
MEWDKVLQTVTGDPTREVIDATSLKNLAALVKYGASKMTPPTDVGWGYYPTALLSWDSLQTQIEVFHDHFEIYDFEVVPARIRHVAVEVAGQLPSQLLPLLAPLKLPS